MKRALAGLAVGLLCLSAGCLSRAIDEVPVLYMTDTGRIFSAQRCARGRKVDLRLPDGQGFLLPRVPSGVGVKYSDGRLSFWGKGDEGLIVVDGKPLIAGIRFAGKSMNTAGN